MRLVQKLQQLANGSDALRLIAREQFAPKPASNR